MIKLASHNSWSYARPTKWYIPRFPVRCQRIDIQQQYLQGVRLFDLRLRYHDKSGFMPAHGACYFKAPIYSPLAFLNGLAERNREDIYVRVTLEFNRKPKNADYIISKFKYYCIYLEQTYQDLHFFGGCAKWSWEVLYNFQTPQPLLLDRYSSTTSWFRSGNRFLRIIDDWWPWLYARFHNHRNYQEYINTYYPLLGTSDNTPPSPDVPWFFIDFVDIL